MFKINDRVRVSSNAPVLKNLAGREGTIVEFLSGDRMLGPSMVAVDLEDLEMASTVPFYFHELINLSE